MRGLDIGNSVTFNKKIKADVCVINKDLCHNLKYTHQSYHTDDRLELGGEVLFKHGFDCDNVIFI